MKKLMLILGFIVLVVAGSAKADLIVTTGTTSDPGTVHEYMSAAGSTVCNHTTVSNGFTVDGSYLDDVWAIIISEIDDEFVLNGYGWSGYNKFRFTMFGDEINPLVSAYEVIFIINDDDPALFMIGDLNLTVGLGEDVVLRQESVSINGKAFGNISDIFFSEDINSYSLDSVVLDSTIPEPATITLLVFGGMAVFVRSRCSKFCL